MQVTYAPLTNNTAVPCSTGWLIGSSVSGATAPYVLFPYTSVMSPNLATYTGMAYNLSGITPLSFSDGSAGYPLASSGMNMSNANVIAVIPSNVNTNITQFLANNPAGMMIQVCPGASVYATAQSMNQAIPPAAPAIAVTGNTTTTAQTQQQQAQVPTMTTATSNTGIIPLLIKPSITGVPNMQCVPDACPSPPPKSFKNPQTWPKAVIWFLFAFAIILLLSHIYTSITLKNTNTQLKQYQQYVLEHKIK